MRVDAPSFELTRAERGEGSTPAMGKKDKGDLRKRLIPGYQPPASDSDPEVSRLADDLAGSVGKTVEKVTELGLSVIADAGLRAMELLSGSKPPQGSRVMGTAASVFARTRAKAPGFSGQMANKVTGAVVKGGFSVLRAIHETVRPTGRPG
jgi:hypothetical protein